VYYKVYYIIRRYSRYAQTPKDGEILYFNRLGRLDFVPTAEMVSSRNISQYDTLHILVSDRLQSSPSVVHVLIRSRLYYTFYIILLFHFQPPFPHQLLLHLPPRGPHPQHLCYAPPPPPRRESEIPMPEKLTKYLWCPD
jgi:hypothetical protein